LDHRTETLRAWDVAHVWHPFTAQSEWAASSALVIERGEGLYLFDTEGKRYLDGVSSLWCNIHGHRHPALDAAIREQLDRVAHSTLLGVTHPPAIELARELARRAPPGLSRVFYSDDGATAVEVALKLAFQYWQQKRDPEPRRTRFVALGGAYHGDTIGDVSIGGVDRFHAMFAPLLFRALRAPIPHCYRCPLGLARPDCDIACLKEVDRLLTEHGQEVAAVVIEPRVQCAAGMVVHPDGYLKGLRALTRKHGALLIADEVAVGMGRTGKLFACDTEDVAPDFLCLAKGLTGGYLPLAATLTTEEIYQAFIGIPGDEKTFYHGHTYGGNPLGAAVALATLRVFDDEVTLEKLPGKVDILTTALARLAQLPHVGDVRQCGLIAGIELVAQKATKTPYRWVDQVGAKVCSRARDRGLLIRPLGNVIVVMPPLAITEEILSEMLAIIEACIRDVTEGAQGACAGS
jgi:adenosylmethionine-8-amino-7-oxononanoate aminotransferase